MFSGIRSIIFGYSETDGSTSNANSEPISPSASDGSIERSSSANNEHTSAALLEQTLNAATTKFTEQLLPQQASIDQLQSSSRQLLPSLNEQQEEDELKKKKQAELSSERNNIENDDDDDNGFEADSWELLDLVEKTGTEPTTAVSSLVASSSLNSSVQKDDSSLLCKSTSGILKSSSGNGNKSLENSTTLSQQLRQRPKVSFETPDLVKDKHEIERIKPKGNNSRNKNNDKRNKHSEGLPTIRCIRRHQLPLAKANAKNFQKSANSKQADYANCDKSKTMESSVDTKLTKDLGIEKTIVSVGSNIVKGPVLNYAAALLVKPNKVETSPEKASASASGSGSQQAVRKDVVASLKSSGAVKRNRPVSTSSWSSSDELETVDGNRKELEGAARKTTNSKDGKAADEKVEMKEDDDESLMSSGFSDCDYGYDGFNDFIMRPKRANSKKSRKVSASSSSSALVSMGKRSDRTRAAPIVKAPAKETEAKEVPPNVSASSKNVKPKKKKMILSPSTNCTDFLKPRLDVEQKVVVKSVPEARKASLMMPPPPPSKQSQAGSSNSSGNDSSDMADMEGSWYVTPPPCFTGANKLPDDGKARQPKVAARENALIENPSIYIASSLKKQVVATVKSNSVSCISSSRPIVLKKAAKNAKPQSKPVETKDANTEARIEDSAWLSDNDDIDFDEANLLDDFLPAKKASKTKQAAKSAGKVRLSIETAPNKAANVQKSAQENRSKDIVPSGVKEGGKKAWRNKFMVDDWDLDDQEDPDSDFDIWSNEMDDARSKKKKKKVNGKGRRQQGTKEQQKKTSMPKSVEGSLSLLDSAVGYESDVSIQSPALVGVIEGSSGGSNSADSVELISMKTVSTPDLIGDDLAESSEISNDDQENQLIPECNNKSASVERRQVRPIEPERRPGWQLKRQRSKRRLLSSTALVSSKQVLATRGVTKVGGQSGAESDSSSPSRSTLIDRIGSSIVANLTNLTSNLMTSSAMPACVGATQNRPMSSAFEESERMNQVQVVRSAVSDLVGRKQLSKGSLRRQNVCARPSNSLRRPDRRLKMVNTPNGVSINRKTHTNFH